MCGRYTLTTDPRAIEMRFSVTLPTAEGTRRYNVCPTEPVLVLRTRGEAGEDPFAEILRWGLVPAWAENPKSGPPMINARVESVAKRKPFAELLPRADRRCLILADGFYEWQKPEDPKGARRPMRFTLRDEEPFAFAGLCASWYPHDDGEPIHSCTLITTTPNALVAPVHDRMPAMLVGSEAWSAWLSPELDPSDVLALVQPADADLMTAAPVSPKVNKAGYDEPDVLEPAST